MTRRRLWAAIVVTASVVAGVAIPDSAGAQEPRLTVDQAVKVAIERSPVLAAERLSAQAAQLRTEQSRTGWLPRATLDASYRYQGPVPELSIDTGITPPGASAPIAISREAGSAHNAGTNLKVGWRAYDFAARDLRTEAAEAAVRAAVAQGDERRVELAFAVRSAYLTVLFFDASRDVTLRSLQTAQAERAEQALRRKAGVGTALDLASVDMRLAALDTREVELRRSADQARTTLRILLGLPDGAPITLGDDLAGLSGGAFSEGGPSTPTLARLDAQGESLERQRDALYRSFFPTLDVTAQVGYVFPATMFDTESAGFIWAAGVSLTWELFDGDLKRRQREELEVQSQSLHQLADATREDMARRVADARGRLAAARESEAAAARQVAVSEVYLSAARSAVDARTGTALEVRKAEEAVDGAHLAVVQARFQAAAALAEGLRAVGLVSATANPSPGAVVPSPAGAQTPENRESLR